MLSSYLLKMYARYIFVIFTALQIFYVGVDYIENAPKLPDSANLRLLYAMYVFGVAMKITLPLSLIFAMVASKIHLIRANELVVVYALGVSKREVIRPFILLASLVTVVYVGLFLTPFAYFEQRANAIKEDRYFVSVTEDIFVTYDNNYIYMERLFPLQKSAVGLRIFEVGPDGLELLITSESAYFVDNKWRLFEGEIITKPEVHGIQEEGLKTVHFETYDMLEGFEPTILDKVYEGKTSYSLLDAYDAIMILSRQEVNIDRILGAAVSTVLLPLIAPILVVMIFFFVPISSRFFNVALFSSGAIFTTLVLWGFLFAMSTLAQNGVVNVWVGLGLPFTLLFLLSLYMHRRFS